MPFIALRRDMMTLMAPTIDKDLIETPGWLGHTLSRDVACLLPTGLLRGRVDVMTNARLSDHLAQLGGLLVVRHGLLTPYGETLNSPAAKRLDAVVVNLTQTIGVSEWS
ncbi:MAG: hypothetical protein ACREOQ_14595 [Gemmatimonadales bacterium]